MTIKFVLGFHNHQPVGNFDHVIEENYQKAYLPFIETVKNYPKIKFALHLSGCLFEWLETHHFEYFDELGNLISQGRVEMLSGGFYEPIFPAIPKELQVQQLKIMNQYLQEKFNVSPTGAWVVERVWEPQLAQSYAEAGIKYVGLDDFHFGLTGLKNHQLRGYYYTEYENNKLGVFPIDQQLRYLTPFAEVSKIKEYVENVRKENPDATLIIWDDGEKLGGWPKTYRWVYEECWLEKFFEYLSDEDSNVETVLPEEVFRTQQPLGRVYLPAASYQEMCVWALPAEMGKKVDAAIKSAKKQGKFEDARILYNAASWRNFLTKYTESDFMLKRGLFLHKQFKDLKNSLENIEQMDNFIEIIDKLEIAEAAILKSQCNCAYWHGVFGGLYLPHLRRAIFENQIICAENLVQIYKLLMGKGSEVSKSWLEDFDCDGDEEACVLLEKAAFWLKPSKGGSLVGWDIFSKRINLLSTLMRRYEMYHDAPVKYSDTEVEEEHGTIHETVKKLTVEQKNALLYDWHTRSFGLDHFYGELLGSEQLRNNKAHDVSDFVNSRFGIKKISDSVWKLKTTGHLYLDRRYTLQLEKTYKFSKGGNINYHVEITRIADENELEEIQVYYAPEFNFGLFAGNDENRFYQIERNNLTEELMLKENLDYESSELNLVSKPEDILIRIACAEPANFRCYPVYTVAQSEVEFELIYQSTAVLPHVKIALKANETCVLDFNFEIS